ncbi:hypothetical protein H0H93_010020 [Arthromyces matolae]|nr:hypothetical protein H0H93_010020 [Arthromyces matolae]
MMALSINLEEAQQIIDQNFPPSHHHSPDMKTYVADLLKRGDAANPSSSCFITIARPEPTVVGAYYQNSLPVIAKLLTMIRTQTAIPIRESTLDVSQSIVPYHYLLSPPSPFPSSSIMSLPVARASGLLSEKTELSIDLLLGAFLGQLHSGVQNDWYGQPTLENSQTPATDAGYSWQETFTQWLENLLQQVEKNESAYHVNLPFNDIRRYLSRAIGSFLFDDVEVPSLIWFTGSDDDIYVSLPSSSAASSTTTEPGTIAAILPNVSHAIWGDPLLEAFMMGPEDKVELGEGPSQAFIEGYKGGGGGQVFIFLRQKTKRLWYSIFLALVMLTKYGPCKEGEEVWIEEKRQWAREALDKLVLALKDAPYY